MKRKNAKVMSVSKGPMKGIILTVLLGTTLYLPGLASADDISNTTITNKIIHLFGGEHVSNVQVGTGAALMVLDGTLDTIHVYDGGMVKTMQDGLAAENITVDDGIYMAAGNSITNNVVMNDHSSVLLGHTATIDNCTNNGGIYAVGSSKTKTKNLTLNGGKVELSNTTANTATLYDDVENYTLEGTSNLNGGTIDLANDYELPTTDLDLSKVTGTLRTGSYRTLTIDNLNGNGTTFLLRTDLASEQNGDKIVVNKASAGSGGIIDVVDDSSVTQQEVLGKKALLVVDDKSGVTNWKAGSTLGKGGLWEYTPTIKKGDEIGKGDDNWYLTNIDKEKSAVSTARIEGTASDYALWRDALINDSLRGRLGDLRNNDEKAGIWARFKTGKNSGDDFSGSYQTYQVGFDSKKGNSIYGVALDRTTGSSDQHYSESDQNMNAFSAYITNYHPSGAYSDLVLRAGRLKSDINMSGLYDDHYSTSAWGYGLSYELGKKITAPSGWFIEPQGQISFGYLKSGNFTSDKDVLLHRDATKSVIGRIGFTAGRNINKDVSFYLKGNLFHDFSGKTDVTLSTAGATPLTEETDFGGTWTEVGLGTNVKLSNKTYLYGDISKTFGGTIKKKWQANVGLRWTF